MTWNGGISPVASGGRPRWHPPGASQRQAMPRSNSASLCPVVGTNLLPFPRSLAYPGLLARGRRCISSLRPGRRDGRGGWRHTRFPRRHAQIKRQQQTAGNRLLRQRLPLRLLAHILNQVLQASSAPPLHRIANHRHLPPGPMDPSHVSGMTPRSGGAPRCTARPRRTGYSDRLGQPCPRRYTT